ncbi:MAG: hypothetical protein ACF8XB_18735 [Planctomycetota bacterium JB042]
MYKLEECGLYQRASSKRNRELLRGGIGVFLAELDRWRKERGSLRNTCTFQTVATKTQDARSPVYCYELEGVDEESAVLTTWNGFDSFDDGNFRSVNGDSEPGETPEVFVEDAPEGGIRGYPSHFWLFPAHEKFATVRVESRLENGVPELRHYGRAFLRDHLPREGLDPKKSKSAIAVFDAKLKLDKATLAEIRKHRVNITAVRGRNILRPVKKPRRAARWYDGLLGLVGVKMDTRDDVEHELRDQRIDTTIHLEEKLSAEQLRDVFKGRPQLGYDDCDVGFVIKGDKTIWLGSAQATTTLNLDVELNEGIPSAKSLLASLRSVGGDEVEKLLRKA